MTTAGVTTEVTVVGGIAMSVVGLGAEVQGNTGSTLMLFAPTVSHSAIQIADGVIECGDGWCTTLVIENHGTEKLIFKRRMVLGTVCPVDEVETPAAGINSGDKISSNTQETTTRRELPATIAEESVCPRKEKGQDHERDGVERSGPPGEVEEIPQEQLLVAWTCCKKNW